MAENENIYHTVLVKGSEGLAFNFRETLGYPFFNPFHISEILTMYQLLRLLNTLQSSSSTVQRFLTVDFKSLSWKALMCQMKKFDRGFGWEAKGQSHLRNLITAEVKLFMEMQRDEKSVEPVHLHYKDQILVKRSSKSSK